MKKRIEELICIITFIIIGLVIHSEVQANSIDKIDMDIYIDQNGNAHVTEIWDCYTYEGTEMYHPYYNLGNSKISNLKVSNNEKQYATLDSWDTKKIFEQKAYKCGINNVNDGVEICWGMSKYGQNVYTVKYDITKFVAELTDSQMIYWTLIPDNFSVSPKNLKIKIYADKKFENTIDVWGYGKYGALCYVDKNDGAIYIDTEGNELLSSEYITLLAKFPEETFNTNNVLENNFEYYYIMAEYGTIKYEEPESSTSKNKGMSKEKSEAIKIILLGTIPWFFLLFVPIIVKFTRSNSRIFKYGKAGKNINKAVSYYRDIPLNGDILKAYYLSSRYKLIKNRTDILGAILLKWIKLEIIKIQKDKYDEIVNKEETSFILKNKTADCFASNEEFNLFKMMLEASKNGILESKEFEFWCEKNYSTIINWFDSIIVEQEKIFVNDGSIVCKNMKRGNKEFTATEKLKSEAEKIAGLKKFLLDYTLIKEREAIEVELFEDYLIYAEMLGIAKQVSKQFKDIYPNVIEQTHYTDYDDILCIDYCASTWYSSAMSKWNDIQRNSAHDYSSSSYSSGGEGRSSGGGGSSSFGGGRGRRRIPIK